MHRTLTLPLLATAALIGSLAPSTSAEVKTPTIPVELDAFRQWERWPYQRIGARAYMRSTYDRRGGNETADASHFLYQEAEDFNVTLDVEGRGVLYFKRTNHWHGSPWHYEVDGTDHIVKETTTADPNKKLEHSVFIPEEIFPNPLTWTYAITKGADLMWRPIPFEESMRLAYSRTFYGTGYYIYHLYMEDAPLSQPIEAFDGKTPPDPAVLELLNRSGTDIAPKDIAKEKATLALEGEGPVRWCRIDQAPSMIRAIKLALPKAHAIDLGRMGIRVTWDDREHASIDAPLALFFGAGTLYNRDGREYLVKAFPVNIRDEGEKIHLACYFPMPFFKSATFEFTNIPEGIESAIDFEVRYEPYTDPPEHVGYFHATYRDHPELEIGRDVFLLDTEEVEGGGDWSGSFVGTSFIFSHRAYLPTLEGDPRFLFDDARTPQAYGTGTEEWGGGGDYWGGRNMTLPFAGHPTGAPDPKSAKDPEDLIQSAYRFLLSDLMPFGKRAVIRLEHGGHNDSTEHYETVTYWYGLPSPSLVLTDEFNVGDPASETAHAYDSPEASDVQTVTSLYELGPDRIEVHAATSPLSHPPDHVDFYFDADADKTYHIWVRGRAVKKDPQTDSVWLQFDRRMMTQTLDESYFNTYGFGNWLDGGDKSLTYRWASGRPGGAPLTVRFDKSGRHFLRMQPRERDCRIDQIWLSTSQQTCPTDPEAAPRPAQTEPGSIDEIVLDTTNSRAPGGQCRIVKDDGASTGQAFEFFGENQDLVIYEPETEIGRYTRTQSEFTLKLDPENLGVLLRRTLDYRFPNQRAEVYVAPVDARGEATNWAHAGDWYLAGSNTCYHSYADHELGPSKPVVQTSNRYLRDDEFLIARRLTRGLDRIRVRVKFTPIKRPLLPGMDVPDLAWSELRYKAYSYVMPKHPLR